MILTFFRAMFAFALLLDARFSLHQRAAIILSRFLEGLVEIEKEVGVMRGAGEALSIGWCAPANPLSLVPPDLRLTVLSIVGKRP